MSILVGYIRVTGNERLDQAIEHELAQLPHITAIYSDQPGVKDQPALQAALASMKPSDCLAIAMLAQLKRGAGGLIKFVDMLRGKGFHLLVLGDVLIDTRSDPGWSFFAHLRALAEAERDLSREHTHIERTVIGRPRGRKGGARKKLSPDMVAAAQTRLWTRTHKSIRVVDVAREFGVSRATLYRSGAVERPY